MIMLSRLPPNRALGQKLLAVLAAAALALTATSAKPHMHVEPDGTATSWYPLECCNDRDCRPIASIKMAKEGMWMTTVDGFTVLVGPDDYRHPSQDMRWHVCLGKDGRGDHFLQCVFQPPQTQLAPTRHPRLMVGSRPRIS